MVLMVMSPSDAAELVATFKDEWAANREQIATLDRWQRGDHELPLVPRQHTKEYEELLRRSVTPWGSLIVTAVAQSLYVEGYRSANDPANASPWEIWQRNRLDARQIPVHRGAVGTGLSYVKVMPGSVDDGPMPVVSGVSSARMIALYEDPASDEWPMYALQGDRTKIDGVDGTRFQVIDDVAVYTVDVPDGRDPKFITFDEHGAGVCPVVRFSNMLDLDGRSVGEIEAVIPLIARIDQDTFDRLVVQRFGSWKVRTIAGMAEPETDSEKRAAALALRVEDLLVSESPDTKFGTLPETPLDGYIKARDADVKDLAAVSQTPPHHLLGQMSNLSAEALAAAEAGLNRKVEERKHSFGESWEQVLRLAAHLRGDEVGASDLSAQVHWRDMESRSLAQAADALGKLATMLNVPVPLLWEKIPGFTGTDVERAKELFQEGDALDALIRQLSDNTEPALDV